MKLAVVGAGLAGLAVANYFPGEVTLFDAGSGASRVSAGLLHPFLGEKVPFSPRGLEAYAEAKKLIGYRGRPGIMRLLTKEKQRPHFEERVRQFPKLKWLEKTPDFIAVNEGLWIEEGMTVNVKDYLEHLLDKSGAEVVKQKITDLNELSRFDAVVLASGAGIKELAPRLALKFVKGQALNVAFDHDLPHSIIGKGHLAQTEKGILHLGSTYEHDYVDDLTDMEKAKRLLHTQMKPFFPDIDSLPILSCVSAIRVSPKEGVLPIAQKIGERLYVFTGLGSRGLLYHALFGKELAHKIASDLS